MRLYNAWSIDLTTISWNNVDPAPNCQEAQRLLPMLAVETKTHPNEATASHALPSDNILDNEMKTLFPEIENPSREELLLQRPAVGIPFSFSDIMPPGQRSFTTI